MSAEGMNVDYYDEYSIILDCNNSPYPPCAAAEGAIVEAMRMNALQRYPRIEPAELVEAVARYMKVPSECVLLTAGADAAIDLILTTWHTMLPVARLHTYSYAHKHVCVTAHKTEQFNQDLDWVDCENYKTNIVYIANPDNPTGTIYAGERIRELLGKLGARFMIDESYAEYAEESPGSTFARYDDSERVFRIRTFSKAFALAGLRIGYIVTHPVNIQKLKEQHNPKSVSSLAQIAAFQALDNLEYMRRHVKEIRARRDRVVSELKSSGYNIVNTELNFFLIKLSRTGMLWEQLKKDYIHVRIFDSDYFGTPTNFPYLRVTVGSEKDMQIFLEAMTAYEGSRI